MSAAHIPNAPASWPLVPGALAGNLAMEADHAAAPGTSAGAPRRYGYRVGPLGVALGFVVSPGLGSEIALPGAVARIPGTAPWLSGMMSLRGHAIPVFDLAVAFGWPAAAAGALRRVLVLGKGAAAAGLWIDELPREISEAVETAIPAATPPLVRACARAAWSEASLAWIEIDESALFRKLGHREPGDAGAKQAS
jgi:chemotaxis signal transduction protein